MSRVCQITGKRPMTGNTVSHANNRRRRRFLPNLHVQRFWLEGERRFVSLRVSTRGLRTIEKKGIEKIVAELRAKGVEFEDGIADHGYGLVTHMKVPGGFAVQLYQPLYRK